MPEKPLITEATIIQTKGGAITVPENSIAIVNAAGTLMSQTPDGTLSPLGGGGSGVVVVATLAALGTLASAPYSDSQLVYVQSIKSLFMLVVSTAALQTNYRIAASGKAGYQWLRILLRNPYWEQQTAWYIDPGNTSTTASDDNDGHTSATPLLTWTELQWRVWKSVISSNITVTAMSSVTGSTVDTTSTQILLDISGTSFFSIVGTGLSGTALYSGTITSYTPQTAAPSATDNQLQDTGVPTSFTSAGLLANGLIAKRTNSSAAYFYIASDLGSQTARISNPMDTNTLNNLTLNPGDSYSVFQLTQVPQITFPLGRLGRNRMTECYINWSSLVQLDSVFNTRCFHAQTSFLSFTGIFSLFNSALDAGSTTSMPNFYPVGPGVANLKGGMLRSNSVAVASQGGQLNLSGATLERVWWQTVSGGLTVVNGTVSVFDVGSAPMMQADYWASILYFKAGNLGNAAISGKGNTGPVLSVLNWSKHVYLTSGVVPAVDASTSGSSIQVGATSTNVAALPILNSTTYDNGIFASQ